jgi:hypothetical protein
VQASAAAGLTGETLLAALLDLSKSAVAAAARVGSGGV